MDFFDCFFTDKDIVYNQYKNDYKDIVEKYMNFEINKFEREIDNFSPDIYFIHLESVNGDFMNKGIISNFDNYSHINGIVFDNFYSNAIQTLRAQESILCALPPSMNGYFQSNFDPSGLLCIPKILKKYNYESLFFKDNELEFANAGDFMYKIGFDETHSEDIMENNDQYYKYEWGFREDIFYKRVDEYLKKYKNNKKFVYIAVSATNHYPFNIVDKRYLSELPVKNPSIFLDRLKNTTYTQDKYLELVLENIKNDNRDKFIFLFGDHAWPIGLHKNNNFNQTYGYRENFYIPFAFLYFGKDRESFDLTTRVSNMYNQIDILKTVLDLLNIKTSNSYLGNSFYDELHGDKEKIEKDNCSISVQPYSSKYITFFYDDKHYIYDIRKRSAYYFDILNDKNEEHKKNISKDEFLSTYNSCKNSIGY